MSTEQPDLAAALVAALGAAGFKVRQLTAEQLRRKMAFLEAQHALAEAEDRVVEARQTYNSIKQLLEQEGHEAPDLPELMGQETAHSKPQSSKAKEWIEGPKNQVMSPSFVATSDLSPASIHAINVLADAPAPMRPAEVLKEFEARGWVEPQWKTPAQSVYGALKRAEQAGMVTRNEEDGRWQISGRAFEKERVANRRVGIRHTCSACNKGFYVVGAKETQRDFSCPYCKSRTPKISSRDRDDDGNKSKGGD